jgi:hypothetical protein
MAPLQIWIQVDRGRDPVAWDRKGREHGGQIEISQGPFLRRFPLSIGGSEPARAHRLRSLRPMH